jgi:hypothetical protein
MIRTELLGICFRSGGALQAKVVVVLGEFKFGDGYTVAFETVKDYAVGRWKDRKD